MTEAEYMNEEEVYWAAEQHPEKLPVWEREAWHRDAWDREQVALYEATRNAHAVYSPPPVEQCGEVWQR